MNTGLKPCATQETTATNDYVAGFATSATYPFALSLSKGELCVRGSTSLS